MDLPRAPAWLSRIAKAEWKRIGEELVRQSLLRAVHLPSLEAVCSCYSQWRAALKKAKVEVVVTATGGVAANPLIAVEQKYLLQLRLLLAEFKITIASQPPVAAAHGKKKSAMANILDRRRNLRLVK